jgi:acyl-homoserine-lactone acylase
MPDSHARRLTTAPSARRGTTARRGLVAIAATGCGLLLACSAEPPAAEPSTYSAIIRRTSHGIPHIQAADLASLGFGEGYAFAADHLCSLADQVIYVRGERARYFGRGEDGRNFASDVTMKALRVWQQAARELERAPIEHREWIEGYTAGYNLYLRETGADQVKGWCQGQPWVREIEPTDVVAYRRMLGLTAPRFATMIAAAQPPATTGGMPSAAGGTAATSSPRRDATADVIDAELASNGWAIGSDRSESGGGMLIANPHYPWEGSNRFWEKHLTIPGRLDGYGVSLLGAPGISIGFNANVAWTHTVSAGQRHTLYRLRLTDDDPTVYLYDGERRPMRKETVAVEVRGEGGSVASESRTVWFSHYGPVLDWPELPWTARSAITYRDANEANDDSTATYLAMIQASGMDEFQKAHQELQGILFVNTIAVSSDGRAWYADVSAAPNLSDATVAAWRERLAGDAAARDLYDRRGMILLDGSTSRDEWMADERARDAGVAPYASVPKIERRDYVFNANDSYWTPHAEERLEGFSPAHGPERAVRSLRTRQNMTTLSDVSAGGPAGADGKWSLAELEAAALSNRSFTAKLLLPELVSRCRAIGWARLDGKPVKLAPACDVLGAWDGKLDLDSKGAVLFREWITRYEPADLRGDGALYAVDFDPADPIGTPRGLARGSLALKNLALAMKVLERAGLPLDVTLRAVQHDGRGGEPVPIHGGDGTYEGVENVVRYAKNGTTLEPPAALSPQVEGSRWLTGDGYPITTGTSFLMALEFTREGPRAHAFLTYGQSGDPQSPGFLDQTRLFSEKAWRPILFAEKDIAADPELTTASVTAPRR